jgi:outer membrane lipoprotein-sorting protein
MKIQIFSNLTAALFIFSAFGAYSKTKEPQLQKILSKLRSAGLLTLEVEKKTKSELLGNETKAPGKIYVSANKFRWDSNGDENSKIIYDGQNIWTVQEPPRGFKAPPQITKMKLGKKSEGQVFLNSLFKENFKDYFDITKKTQIDQNWKFHLKPLQKNIGISELIILVSPQSELKEISYVDEIQNKIVVQISKITTSKTANGKLFQFKPPTGSQVNEL